MSAGGDAETPVCEARTRKAADEQALVLVAEGLHPTVKAEDGGYAIWVPDDEGALARASLAAYEGENPPSAPPAGPVPPAPWLVTFSLATAMVVFHASVTGPRDGASRWFERGSADAWEIVHGQWWRSFTAITLHADMTHVLGNALAGVLFVSEACRQLGTGFGLALTVLAGAAGHAITAVHYGRHHESVGASTAVFGALGLMTGVAALRRLARGERGRRPLVPIAAGLGVIAMLGTGPQADIWGHVYGFLAGCVLGVLGDLGPGRDAGAATHAGLAIASLGSLGLAWWVALL